jgi:hypothetical protein
MKKAFCIALLLLTVLAGYGQTQKDENEIVQAHFGMKKKDIVAEFVKVEGFKGDAFWKLYDEYELSRRTDANKKFTLMNNYVKNYSSLSEAETDEIIKEIIELTASQDKLLSSYYKKVKKSCGIIIAAQFYQIEWYILSEIRTTILESIPIINKLEKKGK